MFRGVGSALILAGCLGLGFLSREKMNGRIRALQQMMDILELFESEVRYGKTVLPECCGRIGNRIRGGFGEALVRVAEKYRENAGESFEVIFREEVGRQLEEMPLKPEDIRLFLQSISSTGFSEGQMQLRTMEQSRERLGKTKEKLERENSEKGRIVVGLGAMSGLLLILILW